LKEIVIGGEKKVKKNEYILVQPQFSIRASRKRKLINHLKEKSKKKKTT